MGVKRPELGLVIMMGFGEFEHCSPSGVTLVMQYKHENHPGQTEEVVITHKALQVYLYIEARPQLLQQIKKKINCLHCQQ